MNNLLIFSYWLIDRGWIFRTQFEVTIRQGLVLPRHDLWVRNDSIKILIDHR